MSTDYWFQIMHRRLSRRRALAATGATAIGAALLAACGGDDSSGSGDGASLVTPAVDESKEAKRGGVWLDWATADFQTFDPHFTSLPHPSRFLFSTLMRKKPGILEPAQGDYMLDAAGSYELSPDKLQLTMKMRDNHTWHNVAPLNGRKVTAQDVVFSYQRLVKLGSARATFAGELSGPIDSVTAVDDKTVVFKLNQVYAGILALLAGGGSGNLLLIPPESESQYDPRQVGLGSGPWQIKEHTPSAGTVYKRHEGWHSKEQLYVDEVRAPVVSEYAAGLAQFSSGAIYRYEVSPDDILNTKKSNPVLQLYQNDPETGRFVFFGWNPALGDKTPFRDKRLRQAFSMSWDRDLWIDAFYNVDKFRQEGLPVQTAWNAAVPLVDSGWWLDPKGKDFGPNAKYYQHNPAESKKLIAAAGFPNGLDVEAHYITSTNYGLDFVKVVETLLGFANDVGMRMTTFPVDFNTEWRPKFADAQGDFPGVSFRNLASGNPDIPEKQIQVYTPLGGILYTGHFAETSSFRKGDPEVIDLLMKTRTEFDLEKRRAMIHDFQRMAAEKLYVLHSPGGGSSFTIAWPALRNQNVQRGEVVPYVGQWLDPTKAPIAKT